jgi:hypothetical protein
MKIRLALFSLLLLGASRHAVSPELLVRRSHLIVRATSLGYFRPPTLPRAGRGDIFTNETVAASGLVRFRVDEVVKGKWTERTIDVEGKVVDPDDYNEAAVPYTTARKAAGEFVTGRPYLLILHDTGTQFITSWPSSIAPTNEQLHDENDPWMTWVRDRVKQESR